MSWPQWPAGSQPSVVNPAPAVPPASLQYTPDQWAQVQQQNWSQWAQWQQQYQQWHQQYGAEYQKSMNAINAQMGQQPPVGPGNLPNVAVPPPLPQEVKPPLPLDEPPPNVQYSSMPPAPQQPSYSNPPPKSQRNNWQQNQRYDNNQYQNKRQHDQHGEEHGSSKRTNTGAWQRDNPQQPPPQQPLPQQPPPLPPQLQPVQPPPLMPPKQNIEELSEAEKKFDKQFAEWEAQFNRWKEQNVAHPDKQQYREYEKRWETWRAQLLERREQMKRKRLGLQADSPNITNNSSIKMAPQISNPPSLFAGLAVGNKGAQTQKGLLPTPNVPLNKPPPNLNDEPLTFKKAKFPEMPPINISVMPDYDEGGNDFLKSAPSAGIPGLDLVKDDGRQLPDNRDDNLMDFNDGVKKEPDFAAISKGINSILGDQKLMNMLSMVSQNHTQPVETIATDSVAKIQTQQTGENINEHSYGEYSNFSEGCNNQQQQVQPPPLMQRECVTNFDDQTRSSFTTGQNDQWVGNNDNYPRGNQPNFENNQFGNRFGAFKNKRFENDFERPPPNQNRGNFNAGGQFPPPPQLQENFNRDNNNRNFNAKPNRGSYDNEEEEYYDDYENQYPPRNEGNNRQFGNNNNNRQFGFRGGPDRGDDYADDDYYEEEEDPRQFENDRQRGSFGGNNNSGPPSRNESFSRDYASGGFDDNYEEQQEPPYDEDDNNWVEPEEYEQEPEPVVEEPPEKEVELLKPATIIDYDHKSIKSGEPEVLIEPMRMFDYRHKALSRIPLPQRPKWLSEAVRFIHEFDPPLVRAYENNLRRYPPEGWREERPYQAERWPPRGNPRPPPYERNRPYNSEQTRPHDENRRNVDNRPYNFGGKSGGQQQKGSSKAQDLTADNFDDFDEDVEEISDDEEDWKNEANVEHHNQPQVLFDHKTDFDKREGPAPVKSVVLIEDLICAPGRYHRPPRIVIILRGPPGSGKTFLAKLIKDKEVESGGSAPRILSLDDYFMVEQEKEVTEEGKTVKIKEMIYEYEAEMEESYRMSLVRSFKKTITDGYFPFIIVDNVNDKVKYFGEMWSFAKQNGFQVYICQLDLDVQSCTKRNIHGRSETDIEKCVEGWESTPAHHPVLDATSLLQQAGAIAEVEMEEVNSPEGEVAGEEDGSEEDQVVTRSKWDNFDLSVDNLAKLDGVNKPLRPSRTMEEYLQLDEEWAPAKSTKPGQKRVRWADLEEQKQQEKMRAIGFVVGQTNWNRMMDPTKGGSALTQTKYIERTGHRH